MNAFTTTDKGLVYVDSMGGGITEILKELQYGYSSELDTIAYVMKGKELGVVSIDRATSPEYSYYERMGTELSDWLPLGIVERIEIYW